MKLTDDEDNFDRYLKECLFESYNWTVLNDGRFVYIGCTPELLNVIEKVFGIKHNHGMPPEFTFNGYRFALVYADTDIKVIRKLGRV